MRSIWDDDTKVAKLLLLWEKGQSASQIARQLGPGFTRGAVTGKIWRLGLAAKGLRRSGENRLSHDQRRALRRAKSLNAHNGTQGGTHGGQPTANHAASQSDGAQPPPQPQVRRAPRNPYDGLQNRLAPDVSVFDSPLDAEIPQSQRRKLIDLEPDHCRWPIGNPRNDDFAFCGGQRLIGVSYCEHHLRRAYRIADVADGLDRAGDDATIGIATGGAHDVDAKLAEKVTVHEDA